MFTKWDERFIKMGGICCGVVELLSGQQEDRCCDSEGQTYSDYRL